MYVLNRRMFQRGKDNKYFWFHEQSNTFFSVKTYLCCIKENSMTVNEARLIYFSPTHTSKQVAEAIVHGTGIKNVISINLTLQTVEETVIPTSARQQCRQWCGPRRHLSRNIALSELLAKHQTGPTESSGGIRRWYHPQLPHQHGMAGWCRLFCARPNVSQHA